MIDIYKKNVFIFDFDGTIVDSLDMFDIIDKKIIYNLASISVENMYEVRTKYKKESKNSNIYDYISYLNKELNINIKKDQFIELRNKYIVDYVKHVKSKENVSVFINLLKVLNKKLYIVTNNNIINIYKENNPSINNILNKMDDIIVCPKEIKKPSGDIYKIFLDDNNYTNTECIVFDDSKAGAIAANENSIDIINIYDKKSQKYINDISKITKYINLKFNDLIDQELFINNYGNILKNMRIEDTYSIIKYSLELNNVYINAKIKNNIKYILKKVSRSEIDKLLDLLKDHYLEELEDNFDIIAEKALPETALNIFGAFTQDQEFIINNMISFLEIAFDDNIKQAMLSFYNSIDECKERINNALNSANKDVLKHINIGTLVSINEHNLFGIINDIFDKYTENNDEIKCISKGLTSTAFANNNYVFKIGKKRNKFNIKYSKYFLQPHYRKSFDDVIIEVQDRCNNECNEKDVETLYNLLEKDGIYWLDKKIDNIGILLKDNYVHELNTGIYDVNKSDILKKGNLVLFDLDWLYTKSELEKHYKDIDEIENECNMQIVVDNNIDIIKKLFNQTYEKYKIIVSDENLLNIDSRLSLNKSSNIYTIKYNDINLEDYFSLERLVKSLYEKNVNNRTK